MEILCNEVWKDAVGYEGLYEVSSEGNIRKVGGTNKKLTLDRTTGYLKSSMTKNKNTYPETVHRVVAKAFIDRSLSGRYVVVDHIDDVKTNNKLSNLRVISIRENTIKPMNSEEYSAKSVGVCKRGDKFISRAYSKGVRLYLGTFDTEREAREAYNNFLKDKQNEV